jgi:hypothetical protein
MFSVIFRVHVLVPVGQSFSGRAYSALRTVLTADVIQHRQPPPGPPYVPCRLMFVESVAAGDSSRNSGSID